MYTKHRKQNVVYKPCQCSQCRDAPTARLTMSQPSGVATNEIVTQNRSLKNCLVLKKLTQKSAIMISRYKNYMVCGAKLGGLRPLNCRVLMLKYAYAMLRSGVGGGWWHCKKINSPASEFRKRDCLYDK